MKKILVLVVVVFISAMNLYTQTPCELIYFHDCYPLSLQGKIYYFFHEFRERGIKYDEDKIEKAVKYTQSELNYPVEGYVTMRVTINKYGTLTAVNTLDAIDDRVQKIAIRTLKKYQFGPARKDWKNIEDSVEAIFSINLPKKAYDFEFLGKMQKMEIDKSIYPCNRYVNLKKGTGKKIDTLDNVLLECITYNSMQELIQKDTINITCRHTLDEKPIAYSLKDMQLGSEKLLLFEKYLLSQGVCPLCNNMGDCDKLFVKIKVLEINPK
jgi:hypothetical protein